MRRRRFPGRQWQWQVASCKLRVARNVKSCYKLCNWFGLILILDSKLSYTWSVREFLCKCVFECVCEYFHVCVCVCAHQAATGDADVPKRKALQTKNGIRAACNLFRLHVQVAATALASASTPSCSHTLQFDFSRGSSSRGSICSRRTVT